MRPKEGAGKGREKGGREGEGNIRAIEGQKQLTGKEKYSIIY